MTRVVSNYSFRNKLKYVKALTKSGKKTKSNSNVPFTLIAYMKKLVLIKVII